MKLKVVFIAVVVLVLEAFSAPAQAAMRNYGPHPGYLSTSLGERDEKVEDMVVIAPPAPLPNFHDRIFNDRLNQEFTIRYNQQFGYTEQQRVFNAPNRQTYYNDLLGYQGTDEEYSKSRRRFADYMLRRLGEYNADQFFRKSDNLHNVYNVKQALTTVESRVNKQIKISGKYNLGNSTGDVTIRNPWVDTRITLEMGRTQEQFLSLGRNLNRTARLDSYYKFVDGILTLVGSKTLAPGLGTTFTYTTFTNKTGASTRQTVYLAGLSYSY